MLASTWNIELSKFFVINLEMQHFSNNIPPKHILFRISSKTGRILAEYLKWLQPFIRSASNQRDIIIFFQFFKALNNFEDASIEANFEIRKIISKNLSCNQHEWKTQPFNAQEKKFRQNRKVKKRTKKYSVIGIKVQVQKYSRNCNKTLRFSHFHWNIFFIVWSLEEI